MALLEKKVQQLESQVKAFLLPPPLTDHWRPDRVDISTKFRFLKNLLAREMKINSGNNPEHLDHIAERLATLEAVFNNWMDVGANADDVLERIPACSCTNSCLRDEEETEDDKMMSDPACSEFLDYEIEDSKDDELVDEAKQEDSEKEESNSAANDDDAVIPQPIAAEKKKEQGKNKQRQFGDRCRLLGVTMMVTAGALAVAMAKSLMVREIDFLVPT